jgi:hypothetical protein
MTTLLSFAVYAALFYVMMRFGCGAHMGGHRTHAGHGTKSQVK